MGTNYYLHEGKDICSHCGRSDEPVKILHIGKSSMGWCFSLHIHPDEKIMSLKDWRLRWEDGVIKNEYDTIVTPPEMLETVQQRRGSIKSEFEMADMCAMNRCDPGPFGLLRHPIDGYSCIGWGNTYDLCLGDFS